jgi:riboflavin transporter FmnP
VDTKKISLLIVLTALTLALNVSPVKIPAPYAPFLFYQIWEIPIVTATLLYGLAFGVIITVFNTLLLLLIFPGSLPTGPLYNLVAIVSMLIGIIIIKQLSSKLMDGSSDLSLIASITISGITTRVIVMTVMNWTLLPFPPPVGFGIPKEVLVSMLPLIGFFNATLALYTIPISQILTKEIQSRINLT